VSSCTLLSLKQAHKIEKKKKKNTVFVKQKTTAFMFTNFYIVPIVKTDSISIKDDLQVKLLWIVAYEPYASPPSYVSVFSAKTSLLLVSHLGQVDVGKMEAQAQKLVEKLESEKLENIENAANARISKNSTFMELGKFFELSAANSIKTAELLYTPAEFGVFALPEWESAVSEIRNSGALLSTRLSRKCVEVAKKAANGKGAESEAVRFQIWRLASIVAAHLKRKDECTSFPGNYPSPPHSLPSPHPHPPGFYKHQILHKMLRT
jgi:hypothetical protein